MAWIILLISAVFEAIWATALAESDGLTNMLPTIVFLAAYVISIVGLEHAMKSIPTSVAYAVWTGIGSAITVTVAMLMGNEAFSIIKVVLLAGIIGCTIGLKLIPSNTKESAKTKDSA